jgi:hypothetical protein
MAVRINFTENSPKLLKARKKFRPVAEVGKRAGAVPHQATTVRSVTPIKT